MPTMTSQVEIIQVDFFGKTMAKLSTVFPPWPRSKACAAATAPLFVAPKAQFFSPKVDPKEEQKKRQSASSVRYE